MRDISCVTETIVAHRLQHDAELWENEPMECRKRGFTLFEVLIVLVIIGICCAMAVPGFNLLMKKVKAKSVAFELRDAIQLARSDAMAHQRFSGVAIDTGSLSWNRFLDNPTGTRPGAFDSLDTVKFTRTMQGYGTTSRNCTRLNGSICSIVFSPDGSTVNGSSFNLGFRNATANVAMTVMVISATGLTLVEVR
jgi:prepilin-type N-terminal cleavage/methylation domain-containing protein